MSTLLFDLRKQREHALNKAESLVAAAEREHRQMTEAESLEVETLTTAANALAPRIQSLESKNTILKNFPRGVDMIVDGGRQFRRDANKVMQLSDQYATEFFEYVASNGQKIGATLYEGSAGAGGYAVPITVDDQIQKRLGWHILRHTFGTLVKSQGADVATTQALLRHANVSITMDRYVQAVTPAKREAQSRIVRLIPFPRISVEQEAKDCAGSVVPFPDFQGKSESFPRVPTRLTEAASNA